MHINNDRMVCEVNQTRPRSSARVRQTRKLILLGITNLLMAVNVWAAIAAPSRPTATSVCSNSVSLSWTDPNLSTSGEQSIIVQRSTRSLNKGYSTIATLPAYSTAYTDNSVVASKTYYYRIGALNASGRKFMSSGVSVTTPAPLAVSPTTSTDVSDMGGTNLGLDVIAGPSCAWFATTTDAWITIDSGTSGSGTGAVAYSVAENTTADTRTGTVTVASQSVKVTQGGKSCTYSVTPTSTNVAAGGGSGSFSVTTANGCRWTATTSYSWLHTSSTGNGGGSATYTVDANASTSPRTGTITVEGQSYTVTQAGISCTFTLSPTSNTTVGSAGGSYSVSVTAASSTCTWSASSAATWISITSATSFTGSGTVTYTVASNAGNCVARTGTMTIAGQSFTVTQAAGAGSFSLLPTSVSVGSAAGTYSVSVTAGTGCSWTSSSPVTWVTISSSGTGNGLASYTVAANTATSSRSATLTIAGRSFAVTQAGTSCTPPTATTSAANGITSSGAILNGSSNPNGCATTAYFQYGTTTSYGSGTTSQSLGSGTTATSTAATLGSLAASTTYHYRLVASNSGGTTYGADMTFTTSASGGAPTVTTGAASNISSNSATLNGSANPNLLATTIYFQWGTTTAYGSTTASQSIGSGSQAVNVSANLSGLAPSTTYHYRLVASNSGGTTYGADASFATASAGGGAQWAMAIGGTGTDVGYSTASDANGNIFVAGCFNGSVNFGSTTLTSSGAADIFVAKYSPDGNVNFWAVRCGGTGDDRANRVVVDKYGNVLVAGYFTPTGSFGSTNLNVVTGGGGRDAFVAKLSGSNGAVQWVRQIGGYLGYNFEDWANGIAVDPTNGNVVVVGQVSGFVNFGGGEVYTSGLDRDSFVAVYSTSNTYQWARLSNFSSTDQLFATAVDRGRNILICGTYLGPQTGWNGQPMAGDTGGAGGNYGICVAKLSGINGAAVWCKGIYTNGAYAGYTPVDIAADTNSDALLLGNSWFAPVRTECGVTAITPGVQTGFLMKLSGANGSCMWVTNMLPGSAACYPSSVAVNSFNGITVCAAFADKLSTGSTNLTTTSTSDYDIVLQRYSAAGVPLTARQFGGTSADYSKGISFDASGNVLLTGQTQGGNFGAEALPSNGGFDILLMKLAP